MTDTYKPLTFMNESILLELQKIMGMVESMNFGSYDMDKLIIRRELAEAIKKWEALASYKGGEYGTYWKERCRLAELVIENIEPRPVHLLQKITIENWHTFSQSVPPYKEKVDEERLHEK